MNGCGCVCISMAIHESKKVFCHRYAFVYMNLFSCSHQREVSSSYQCLAKVMFKNFLLHDICKLIHYSESHRFFSLLSCMKLQQMQPLSVCVCVCLGVYVRVCMCVCACVCVRAGALTWASDCQRPISLTLTTSCHMHSWVGGELLAFGMRSKDAMGSLYRKEIKMNSKTHFHFIKDLKCLEHTSPLRE